MKESEVYRGFTIYFEQASRRWLVALSGTDPLQEFSAAFQARRAINIHLDGESIARPSRESRPGARGPV